jgi:hemolysin activation/secretion protein
VGEVQAVAAVYRALALAGLAAAGLAIGFAAGTAAAQPVPIPEAPGREQERFREPVLPRAEPRGPVVELRATAAPEQADAIRLTIRRVTIEGSTVYRPEAFAPFYQDLVGREVTLKAIYDLAQRITAKYGADGYVLSRAIVPPQQLSPGGADIRLRVVEGYVDKVVWPDKLAGYRDFFSAWAAKITADRPANVRTIERYLLLGNDLPGLQLRSTLKPSDANTGAATLVVEADEKPLDLQARFDNRGTVSRGPEQYLTAAGFNNLLRQHEAFQLTYAGTFETRELQYLAGAWRQVLNAEGLTATASYGWSDGKPGTDLLKQMRFASRSGIFETGLSYPVIRSRDRNLTLTGLAFASDSHGDYREPAYFDLYTEDRLRGGRLRVDYDFADRLAGVTQVSATFSFGIDGLGSTSNDNPHASRTGGRVDFTKVEGSIGRLQPLGGGFSVFAYAEAQTAGMTLLAPEECSYGGRVIGRAFDPSELVGDSCWSVSGELRYDLSIEGNPLSRTQLYGYVDHGEVIHDDVTDWPTRTQHGTSAGIGVRLGWKDTVLVDLSAAKPVQGRIDDDWRFFVTAVAKY